MSCSSLPPFTNAYSSLYGYTVSGDMFKMSSSVSPVSLPRIFSNACSGFSWSEQIRMKSIKTFLTSASASLLFFFSYSSSAVRISFIEPTTNPSWKNTSLHSSCNSCNFRNFSEVFANNCSVKNSPAFALCVISSAQRRSSHIAFWSSSMFSILSFITNLSWFFLLVKSESF